MRGRVDKAVVGDDGGGVVGDAQGGDDGLDVWYRWGTEVDVEGSDGSGQGGQTAWEREEERSDDERSDEDVFRGRSWESKPK